MNDNFSEEVKEIITYSKQVTRKLKMDVIDTSALVLAIIKQKKNQIYLNFLKKEEKLISQDLISNIKKLENKTNNEEFHLSRSAERALKTTFLESKLFSDDNINLFHLFLTILRNENDSTTKLLNSFDITYDIIKEEYLSKYQVKKKDENVEEENYEIEHAEKNKEHNEIIYIDPTTSKEEYFTTYSNIGFFNFISKNFTSTSSIKSIKVNQINKEKLTIISNFKELKILEIDSSDFQTYSELGNLVNLIEIKINNCALSDLAFISNLKSIEKINFSRNEISDLSPLKYLKRIKYLDISFNQIEDLSPIVDKIKNKPFLLFGNNNIKNVSKSLVLHLLNKEFQYKIEHVLTLKLYAVMIQKYDIAAKIRDLETNFKKSKKFNTEDQQRIANTHIELNFLTIPIKNPPIELIKSGYDDIVAYYKQVSQDQSEKFLFEGKLMVIGEGGTGKSSFVRKMADKNSVLPTELETTFNIDIRQIVFPIKNPHSPSMYINVWDFGGQKIYRGTHQLFFSDKCLYVLVDDNREERTDFSYWLNTVKQLGGKESNVIIVINEKSGRKGNYFDQSGYKYHFREILKDIISIDLKNDKDRIEILQDIVKARCQELPLIGDKLPSSWVEIREELSKLPDNHISFDYFIKLCRSHNVRDIQTLSTYFNNIGVFTHYIDDPSLRDRIYLNSNWLVQTIYEVLDNKKINSKNGKISASEVKEIWKDKGLEFETDRLCSLMGKFGLMYLIEDENIYVIPEKLPTEMPYKSWKFSNENLLKFKYEFENYTPKGIMSKLIVSLNKFIYDQKLVWHKGLNIKYEDCYAEIIESYKNNRDFEIRIYGKNKKGLLAIIIEKFDEILSPYKSLNFEKLVQCTCTICDVSPNPHFFKYSALIKRRAKGIEKIECEKDFEKIGVSELLDGLDKLNLNRKINIFLASSLELMKERRAIEVFINRENKKMIDRNLFLNLNIWEDSLDSISSTRKQDDYNLLVQKSEIFLCLLGSKVGKFTQEEFEESLKSFENGRGVQYIYTYFKKMEKDISSYSTKDLQSLNAFKDRLKEYGHFPNYFSDDKDLTLQLKLQLDKIIDTF